MAVLSEQEKAYLQGVSRAYGDCEQLVKMLKDQCNIPELLIFHDQVSEGIAAKERIVCKRLHITAVKV